MFLPAYSRNLRNYLKHFFFKITICFHFVLSVQTNYKIVLIAHVYRILMSLDGISSVLLRTFKVVAPLVLRCFISFV